MSVRWDDAADRLLTHMVHMDKSDAEIAAAIPGATLTSVEIRRSALGLSRRFGLPDDLSEFERRLEDEAARRKRPGCCLFMHWTEGDQAFSRRHGKPASSPPRPPRPSENPISVKVAGLPAGM